MKYIVLILIISSMIITSSNPQYSSLQALESNVHRHRISTSVNNQQISPESYNINTTGNLDGQTDLSFGASFTSPDIIRTGQLSMNFSHVLQDLLQYRTNFKSLWENQGVMYQTVGHNNYYNQTSNEAILSTSNMTGSNYFEVPVNRNISNLITMQFSVKDYSFNIPPSAEGYFAVIFEFDTISVRYILFTTHNALFDSSNANSTVQLSLTWTGQLSSVNLSQYFDSAFQPHLLKAIRVQSVVNSTYNYSITLDQIGVLEQQSIVQLTNQQTISLVSTVPLERGEHYTVILGNNTIAILNWSLIYHEFKEVNIMISINNHEIFGSSTILIEKSHIGYQINYKFNRIFQTYDLNSTHFNGTEATLNILKQTTIFLNGTFLVLQSENSQFSGIQGTKISFHITNGSYNTVLLSHQDGSVYQTQLNSNVSISDLQIQIPLNWSKGLVNIYIFSVDGGYRHNTIILHDYPAKLVSPSYFTITRGQQINLPILLQNITSGQEINASRIESYYNGSLRSIDDHYGLRIGADEFDLGKTSLLVNASVPGLINVKYNLTILVQPIKLAIQTTTTRVNSSQATVDLTIVGLSNISVPAQLQFVGVYINHTQSISGETSQISLSNIEWKVDKSYSINGTLNIGNSLSIYHFEVIIPAVKTQNTSPLLFSIVSFVGILGTLSYKLYNYRFGDKSINF